MDIKLDYSELLQLCRTLIQEKSYSGEEKGVSDKVKEYMLKHGYDDMIVDKYGNIIGHIKGKRKGSRILFDGHMDTVPVTQPEKWKVDPFQGEMKEGKLYGRGATDMKGALAAMIFAGAQFAKDCDKDFAGDIYVAGVVHEECFEGVAAREISAYVKPDYVIIGEASELNLKIGQRGRAEIVVETFGVPAHSANPDKGNNAVYQMIKVVEAIRTLKPTEHPVLGKGILELTDIKSSPYPGASVVPDYCRATYDRRLLVGETRESVLEPIERLFETLIKENEDMKVKISYAMGKEKCYTGEWIEGERFFPGWLFEEKEQYIQDIKKEMEENGYQPKVTQYNFCTNGSHYAGEAGIKTIGLGPSRENLAHTINEYAEIEQIEKAADCYLLVMKALLK